MQPRNTIAPPLPMPTSPAILPLREQVMLQLADLLMGADDLREMLRSKDAETFRWMDPQIRSVYRTLDEVMSKVSQ